MSAASAARRVASRAALSLALAVASASAARPARAAEEAWLPLGPGARWEFEVHRDHTYRPAHGRVDRTFRAGMLLLEHVQGLGSDGGGRHELRERREETPVGPGVPASLEVSRQEWSADAGVRLHAVEPLGGVAVRFEPPLQLLPPLPATASRWRVGTWRTSEIALPLEAEALGREEVVAGERRWEDCLKVRYAGSVSGAVAVAGGQAQIREGSVERLVWWKQGVGMVREVVTTEGEIELPDGATARIREVATLRLVRHQPPR